MPARLLAALLAVSALLGLTAPATGAVAAVAPPTIQDLVELADIDGLALSPDGHDIAYRVTRPSIALNLTQAAWYTVPVDGSRPPRQIGDGGLALHEPEGTDVELPIWSLDGRWLYYRALINGQVQVWRAARDGSVAEQVTHDDADVEAFVIDATHHRLLYRAGASRAEIADSEKREYDDGILIDQTVDPAMNLYHANIINGRPTTVRVTGGWFHHGGLLDSIPRAAKAIDLVTLKEAVASDVDPAAIGPSVEVFGHEKGKWFQVRSASGDQRGRASVRIEGLAKLLVVTRPDGRELPCRARECLGAPIDLAQWLPGVDALYFSTRDGSRQRLFLWNVGASRARLVADFDGQWTGDRLGYFPCAPAAASIACVRAGAAVPPRLEAIDLSNGKTRVLADPNAALGGDATIRAEELRWTDSAGRSFSGHLFLPSDAGQKRVPLFLTYYVCRGYLRGGTGDEFPLIPMAAHGIASLCIDRTAAAPGANDNVDQYRYALSGITAIVDQLDRRGLVDRRRIGMGGLSFGSEVTAWVAMHSDLLAAAATSSTLFEPAYWWFNGVAGRDIQAGVRRMWQLDAPDETLARWKEISPAYNVEHLHAPLLMQMPEQEFRLNMELYAKLTEAGKATELYAFPDEDHIKLQPRHKLAVYQRNLDWLRYWLQGYVDPDPAKADQYKRWRAFAFKPLASSDDQAGPSQSLSQISTSTSDSRRK